ncbi:Pathogenesis-related protein 1A [Fusarium acuminatum]|uniref:Pathogenesis-related protein 1A n=1 Tax=Fusarium acuminatum TaxID=5515 RepID=A0ABZ2XDA2_9HYPO
MRFSSSIVSLMAAGAIAAPHNDNWQNGNKHYKVVTNFEYVTHYVIGGGGSPQTTCVPQPQKSDFEKQPDVPEQHTPSPVYAQPTTVQFVKTPKQTPRHGSGSDFGPSYDLSADQQRAIYLHNEARKAVGNDPLSWDDSLASGAQEWADYLASIGLLQHSQGDDGENHYMGTTDSPYSAAVKAFLTESSQYNGEAISGSNYMNFGHYTQCVWKYTNKVGMAVSKDSSGTSWVVAHYQRPGNMQVPQKLIFMIHSLILT